MDLKNIKIEDPFWGHMQELVTDVVIPFQEDVLNDRQPGVEKSHAIENFKIAAGLSQGEFYGMVFQDSDVAKWLEGVAYSLIIKPDAALEKRADDIIDIIAAAQQPDGYLNTYFTIKEPDGRWSNLMEGHELYTAGHMIEAAVAYYEATGKRRFLEIVSKLHDCGINIWLYTGWTWEQICSRDAGDTAIEILSYIDVLVDGLFIETLA